MDDGTRGSSVEEGMRGSSVEKGMRDTLKPLISATLISATLNFTNLAFIRKK